MTHIPYKGFSLAVSDLGGGQIRMYFGNASELLQLFRSGKKKGTPARILTSLTPNRMSHFVV